MRISTEEIRLLQFAINEKNFTWSAYQVAQNRLDMIYEAMCAARGIDPRTSGIYEYVELLGETQTPDGTMRSLVDEILRRKENDA